MKKDHIRDYTTEAFRYYAKIGKTAEQLKNDIGMAIIDEKSNVMFSVNKTLSSPIESVILKKEQIINSLQAEIADIDAVDKTLNRLDKDSRQAVQIVYFTDADKALERNDISFRVRKASLTIPCGESTVYRLLKRARNVLAEERGLRIS